MKEILGIPTTDEEGSSVDEQSQETLHLFDKSELDSGSEYQGILFTINNRHSIDERSLGEFYSIRTSKFHVNLPIELPVSHLCTFIEWGRAFIGWCLISYFLLTAK